MQKFAVKLSDSEDESDCQELSPEDIQEIHNRYEDTAAVLFQKYCKPHIQGFLTFGESCNYTLYPGNGQLYRVPKCVFQERGSNHKESATASRLCVIL